MKIYMQIFMYSLFFSLWKYFHVLSQLFMLSAQLRYLRIQSRQPRLPEEPA